MRIRSITVAGSSCPGRNRVLETSGSPSSASAELESDTADVSPGGSGGPMFGWWGNDPRLIGVVSGEEEYSFLGWTFDQDNIMAGGSGFTGLLSWGRTNWPA